MLDAKQDKGTEARCSESLQNQILEVLQASYVAHQVIKVTAMPSNDIP